MPSLAQFITWIVMGLLGGSLAGLMVTRERKGFGLARNMGLGLAGAIVGGLLFRLLGLLPGLDQISISLRDVVAAFVGSLIILAAIGLWQRLQKSQGTMIAACAVQPALLIEQRSGRDSDAAAQSSGRSSSVSRAAVSTTDCRPCGIASTSCRLKKARSTSRRM